MSFDMWVNGTLRIALVVALVLLIRKIGSLIEEMKKKNLQIKDVKRLLREE